MVFNERIHVMLSLLCCQYYKEYFRTSKIYAVMYTDIATTFHKSRKNVGARNVNSRASGERVKVRDVDKS